ncbi:hypothetical protein ACKWTF_008985 [Chironomus riparius]
MEADLQFAYAYSWTIKLDELYEKSSVKLRIRTSNLMIVAGMQFLEVQVLMKIEPTSLIKQKVEEILDCCMLAFALADRSTHGWISKFLLYLYAPQARPRLQLINLPPRKFPKNDVLE